MIFVILLDVIVFISLFYVNAKKGFEETLPMAAFFLIIFPEESKVPLGLFDITTQRLVTLILIFLAIISRKRAGTHRRKLPLKIWILAIAFWWTLATVNSIAFTDSLKALLALFLDYLVIYFLFATYVTSVNTVRRILLGIAGGLILCSVFGCLEAYANWSVVTLFPTEVHRFGTSGALYLDDARGLRVQSTFGHPILFGSALAMGIPMTLYLIATARKRIQKIYLWIGLLFMFTCIFKTSSRGPWIALTLSLIPFLFFGLPRIRKYILIICLFAVTVLVVRPGVTETIWNDYMATVDDHSSQGESYQYRYELYHLVMEKLDQSPLRAIWGYGPQSFPFLHLSGSINGRGMEFVSCDSSIAALLVETGYIGISLIGFVFLYILLTAFRTFRRASRPNDQLCILFFANLSAFYFEMTNVAILGWGQQTILLWVIIAMTMIYPSLLRAERAASRNAIPLDLQNRDIDSTMRVLSPARISWELPDQI
ncbi:O-antigen ligase family protein [Acidicapsa ligni]|uniref:O-antigen ligase family protein n=1 Tax=Acidicapsa ligni TaxID=542300 RepID=UPI0021E00F7B|nr:O-antigen ligase family protein [Acidicapsa ligni]